MKILHVVPSYLPATRYGGTIFAVHGLCRALAALGHDVSVFTTSADGADNSDVPHGEPVDVDGVKVWYFRCGFPRRLYWAPGLARAMSEQLHQYDVLHVHSVFLWPTWAAARAARRAEVPYLVAPHGMLVRDLIRRKSRWLKTAWIGLIERRNLERAAGIHVTALIEQSEIEAFGFRLPPICYVPNGIDPIDSEVLNTAKSELVPRTAYALFLSRINWKKGLDRLVKAWRLVPDLQLVIAGNDEEGYQDTIERLARQVGVADRVRFVGPVRGNEKWLLYKRAELFVLPSYSENFGIVVLEAMAMGCPVLVTADVGLAETVAEVRCGSVVSGEPDELAAAIRAVMADPEARKEMGQRGRIVAQERFLWSQVASQMAEVYGQVISQGVQPPNGF